MTATEQVEPWTFTANSRGYTFFLHGKRYSGAGILDSARGPRGRAAATQTVEYSKYCRQECARRNAELSRNDGEI